jgi:hypothetical protein
MQKALEQRDSGDLLGLLDAGIPLPEALLPALAEVLRDLKYGYATGRGSKLTALDDESILRTYNRLRKYRTALKVGEVHQYLADVKGVSVDTIKRSLKRTKSRS